MAACSIGKREDVIWKREKNKEGGPLRTDHSILLYLLMTWNTGGNGQEKKGRSCLKSSGNANEEPTPNPLSSAMYSAGHSFRKSLGIKGRNLALAARTQKRKGYSKMMKTNRGEAEVSKK